MSVHGVVDGADGHPIENARITLLPPQGAGSPAATTVTSDPRGCFFLYQRAGPENPVYRLTVDSPGRKPVSVDVHSGRLSTLRVTLAAETGADPSTAIPIPRSQRPLLYEARCEPAVKASSISLH